MTDITTEINTTLSDHSRFNGTQIDIIIAFVNELDNDTLHQFENGSERTIMSTYEQLLSVSAGVTRRPNDEEYELESLTTGNRTMRSNPEFFGSFNSSPSYMHGRGGNIYRDQEKPFYNIAGSILTGIGALVTYGAGTAAIAASQAGASITGIAARYALSALGATGASAGALALLRNSFADIQIASNKDLFETVKNYAKLRNKLNDFFQGLYNKVLKDSVKAETALNDEMGAHPLRYSAGSEGQLVRTNLTPLQMLITEDFANANYNISTKILPQAGSSDWHVSVISMRGNERILNKTNMDVLQQVVNRL